MSRIYLTRLVIETQTPMAINTGGRETGFDSQLARDANGIPYIPATSIAGVWRHLTKEDNKLGEQAAEFWFGTTERCSTLTLADGIVHNSQNKPVVGLISSQEIQNDPILALLRQDRPHHREHVRINDRGVAADEAKFDQLLLPAGVRFTVDIRWNSNGQDAQQEKEWQDILACWQKRHFALGATTRNGLGKIRVVASSQQVLDLAGNPTAGERLSEFVKRTDIPTQLDLTAQPQTTPFAELPLQALDNWRCGTGSSLLDPSKKEANVNIITYSEPRIEWHNNTAAIAPNSPVLCGSSIKGILAHRIAYHLRKRLGIWAEDMADCDHETWEKRPIELKQLLGHADQDDHNQSVAGKLFVDDCQIDFEHTIIRTHNSIDRFTGGVRQGALYSEELLYQPCFTLKLWLVPGTSLSPELKGALEDTLSDLQSGLLPFGAGSGRGTSLVMQNQTQEWLVNWNAITEATNEKAKEKAL
ncbi:hypothetical protein ABT56_22140 [Photobacterium aquae]|uniref:CRISPR type III-associated protein domain-containing protein n=1 Tax=Photobacterium aquae TaxID=1195763 RepID=A0A0J1GNY5_9GAMM|nr:RAMP superfamily CRISPR-associated protein [Photobacterium aquae]KLV01460.1 hypothetical protein ABT56_22140 [Photobacterium aquae]